MKYILHNLHMIRARFRSNGWVLAELFVVFLVMWYLCDSLGCLKYTFYRPLGMDISHVYLQLVGETAGIARSGVRRLVVLQPAHERTEQLQYVGGE